MARKLASFFLAAAAQICIAQAYYEYQMYIPNGNQVPDPCQPGAIWAGVGHQSPYGYNARNPFGLDFAAAGHRWTSGLCLLDSDGDGLTNGQELGDPDCVWTMGATPARTAGLSHPGVCPIYSTRCTNAWDVCPNLPKVAPTTTMTTTTTVAPTAGLNSGPSNSTSSIMPSNGSSTKPPSQPSTQPPAQPTTQPPTSPPSWEFAPPDPSSLQSEHLLIIVIVCSCLGFIVMLVALHVLATILRKRMACYAMTDDPGMVSGGPPPAFFKVEKPMAEPASDYSNYKGGFLHHSSPV